MWSAKPSARPAAGWVCSELAASLATSASLDACSAGSMSELSSMKRSKMEVARMKHFGTTSSISGIKLAKLYFSSTE